MNQKNLPNQQELLAELEKLKEVSAKNEMLTRQLSEGASNPQEIQKEIQACVAEQSRIVDKFVSLSDDQIAIKKFQDIVKKIEDLTKTLEQTTDEEKIKSIKDQILKGVEEWVNCLETIIANVIAKTKEEKNNNQ